MSWKNNKSRSSSSSLVTSSKTVFVKNLPTDCTDSELTKVFSQFGEVVKCFAVGKRKKQTEGNAAKYAFVTFSSEDGVHAVLSRKVVKLKQNRLICLAAKRRVRQRIKSKQQNQTKSEPTNDIVNSDSDSGQESEEIEYDHSPDIATLEGQKHSNVQSRSLVLSGLPLLTPTTQSEGASRYRDMIQRLVGRFIPGLESVEPLPQLEDKLILTFSSKNIARKAMTLLNSLSWGEGHLEVKLAALALLETSVRHQKKSKLLIRNLSFKCSIEDLRKSFENYGKVVEAHIPQKPGTDQMLGFGFVTMGNIFEASLALRKMNGCDIKGRKVAVDWALDRKVYLSKKQQNPAAHTQTAVNSENIHETESVAEDSATLSEEEKSDVMSESENSDSDSMSQITDLQPLPSSGNTSKFKSRREDSNDGKCLFLRNLPFSLDEEELASYFTEEFGPIQYAKLVTNRETGMLTGNGFVRFRDESTAEACQQRSEDGLMIEGRTVEVMKAVTKVEANNFSQTHTRKNRKKEDKRNLQMSHVGSIKADSEEFQELSKADKEKRMRAEAEKLEKLKNPNIFVSRDRLSIRNLALSMNDKELQALCAKHTPKGERIRSARIMRDMNRLKEGVGRSRGFGFVEFSSHDAAMCVLKSLNNNPEVLPNKRRLIVEFSLENQRAVKAKQLRLEKSQLRLQQLREEGKESDSVPPKQNDTIAKVKGKRFSKVLDKKNKAKPSHKLEKQNKFNKLKNSGREIKQSSREKGNHKPQTKSLARLNTLNSKRRENNTRKHENKYSSQEKLTNKSQKQGQRPSKQSRLSTDPTQSRRDRKRNVGEREEREERKFEELVRQYQKKLFRINPI